jgi:hypothetical protein
LSDKLGNVNVVGFIRVPSLCEIPLPIPSDLNLSHDTEESESTLACKAGENMRKSLSRRKLTSITKYSSHIRTQIVTYEMPAFVVCIRKCEKNRLRKQAYVSLVIAV